VLEKLEKLAKNPNLGNPSLKNASIRSILITKHNRVYYTLIGKTNLCPYNF
jgi:hypothetical protein